MTVDRYAHAQQLVRSPIVPWQPTDPAALPQSYLDGDRETVRQQRGSA